MQHGHLSPFSISGITFIINIKQGYITISQVTLLTHIVSKTTQGWPNTFKTNCVAHHVI